MSILEAAIAVIKQQHEQLTAAQTATRAHIISQRPQAEYADYERRHGRDNGGKNAGDNAGYASVELHVASAFAHSSFSQFGNNVDTGDVSTESASPLSARFNNPLQAARVIGSPQSSIDPIKTRMAGRCHFKSQRRRREADAVKRLQTLLQQTSSEHDKVAVLEAAAEYISKVQLQQPIQTTSDDDVNKHNANAIAHQSNNAVITHEQMFSAVFTNSTVMEVLLNADSGCILSKECATYFVAPSMSLTSKHLE